MREKSQQRRRHERHSQGYPWEQGETTSWATEQSAAHKRAGVSLPPDGVWYGNSWHNYGASVATRTRQQPASHCLEEARSGIQADDALQEPSVEAAVPHHESPRPLEQAQGKPRGYSGRRARSRRD